MSESPSVIQFKPVPFIFTIAKSKFLSAHTTLPSTILPFSAERKIYQEKVWEEIEKYIYTEENFNENDEQLKTNEKEIVSLLNEYPQNEKITAAFASIKSNFLMTKYVRNQNVNIDDEFLYRFRDYYQKWSDNVEFIDAYGKILYIKIINLIV